MKNVFEALRKIQELLNQINNITVNQATILLEHLTYSNEDEQCINMIQEMVNYKDEVITELERVEQQFQQIYAAEKEELINNGQIKNVKKCVEEILNLKEDIVQREKENMRIMLMKSQKAEKVTKLPISHEQVIAAYKKQQSKT